MIDRAQDRDWWRQALVYQVYPRSFADANGDGLGDLPGITSRIDYLRRLGVDAIWLSPFYPSALADGGYDVDDYRDVDPKLGTLDDFDAMAASAHAAGIKIIVDLVPNHSSDRHRWFVEAVAAGPGSPERERYIFRDGTGPDGNEPPNDWQSVFGGPAWHQVPDGQWYLHLFAPEQPDLNWDDPEVREDFLTTLRFWSDRGVDGFRIDVAHALVKDLSTPYKPWQELAGGTHEHGTHPFWDRDEVHEIYAEWRKLFNSYDPPRTAVAEAWVHPDRRPRYASAEGLGQAFNFDLLEADFEAERFRSIITANLAQAAVNGASSTWVLSNHDVVRHASRYGLPSAKESGIASRPVAGEVGAVPYQSGKEWVNTDGTNPPLDHELGLTRARAASMLIMALPGSTYVYQGEELGLHEVADLPPDALQDPMYLRSGRTEKGRDGCRVPLPWTRDGSSFGFGSNGAHLPQPAWFGDASVEAQDDVPSSTLTLYREALRLRRELQTGETLEWIEAPADVVHFQRPNGWQSITNFGSEPIDLPDGDLLLASADLADGKLPGNATAWLR